MTTTTEHLIPHFEACAAAAAETMSFAAVQAGNIVVVDDPTPALPLGGVRFVRGVVADGAGVDIVVALTDAAADTAMAAVRTDDLAEALSPVVHAVVGGLSALVGARLGVAELHELGVGERLGPPDADVFTAGLFSGDEQIGNVIFFAAPGAFAPAEPELAAATFPDASADAGGAPANPLSLLRGVEMRVTAELGRTRLPVSHVLELGAGSVVELDRAAGTPVDVLVNGTVIARGEVVVVDDEYGVRITEIVGDEEPA